VFQNSAFEILVDRLADYRSPESELRLIPFWIYLLEHTRVEFVEMPGDEFIERRFPGATRFVECKFA